MIPKRPDLKKSHKLIVGEGGSDASFFSAFCATHGILGFAYGHTAQADLAEKEGGFGAFAKYLINLANLPGVDRLTDLVLVFDATDHPVKRFGDLKKQIKRANTANQAAGRLTYDANPAVNSPSSTGVPRMHVLMLPMTGNGGLESLCVDVARDHCEAVHSKGIAIETWVNDFADLACVKWDDAQPWTTEKRDKLRLQAFMSAAWYKKPDVYFSKLFDISGNKVVPLDHPNFDPIKYFLQAVEAL